ncbi:hypothetical protein STAFG_8470 [Streptomyces afghaniensis 772]|uniref:Uncharacterized protein n=1 Tax=Streptomyces afghaniensis 772 TaxID=1283301 RepID=S4N9M9_9ACTN|nr:hypothetical protein STAFG_8470 [Streptomyces afghaniensis 772]
MALLSDGGVLGRTRSIVRVPRRRVVTRCSGSGGRLRSDREGRCHTWG